MAGRRKQYGPADEYEAKLQRVADRLKVKGMEFNWDRWSCWVSFSYRGQLYRFEHSVQRAQARGIELRKGTDAFAQVVLALEDLARITERGIYDLDTWVAGLKLLPAPPQVPDWAKRLQFTEMPDDVEAVETRYRALAKVVHPDAPSGDSAQFVALQQAYQEALQHFKGVNSRG